MNGVLNHCYTVSGALLPSAVAERVKIVIRHRVRRRFDVVSTAARAQVLHDGGNPAAVLALREEDIPPIHGIDDLLKGPVMRCRMRVVSGPDRDNVRVGGVISVRLLLRAHNTIVSHSTLLQVSKGTQLPPICPMLSWKGDLDRSLGVQSGVLREHREMDR